MISFELKERGWRRPALLLPGWGFGPGIFHRSPLPFDFIEWPGPVTSCDLDRAAEFLKSSGIGPVEVVGWSLGGIYAWRFFRRYPHLVSRLYLFSLRKGYPRRELEFHRRMVRRDKEKALMAFYRSCFDAMDPGFFLGFLDSHADEAMALWGRRDLEKGLDVLGAVRLDGLGPAPALHFHGEGDLVAPLEEAVEIGGNGPVVIPSGGHLPFMLGVCAEIIGNG